VYNTASSSTVFLTPIMSPSVSSNRRNNSLPTSSSIVRWRHGEKPSLEENSSGKMKMTLLTNRSQSKPKEAVKRELSFVKCGHYKKKGYTDDKCWIKHPELCPQKGENTGKQSDTRFAMSALVKRTVKPAEQKQTSNSDQEKWYLDSAASEHFSPHRDIFETYEELSKPCEIVTAEGNTVYGIGKGTVKVQAVAEKKVIELQLNNVTFVPREFRDATISEIGMKDIIVTQFSNPREIETALFELDRVTWDPASETLMSLKTRIMSLLTTSDL
jgi:hypothetical protein